jgi:release factor glutamine methyltransferase
VSAPRATSAASDASPPGGRAASGTRAKSDSWTVLDLLRWTTQHFREAGIDSPRLDAECLLAFALGVERMQRYLDFDKPVSPAERGRFRELVRRRGRERVPVAQLVGRREFWSLSLRVSGAVLTPRPDTETLVQAALDLFPRREAALRVLDLGTGSGAVALALASERPRAQLTATDISAAALEIARANADELHMAERIRFVQGDLFDPVSEDRFDLIVSNPPYVGESQRSELAPELAHEPPEALFAGPDGRAVLRRLAAEAGSRLLTGGAVAVELAPDQAGCFSDWCREAGLLDVTVQRDLVGRPRVVTARGGG